MIMRGIRHAAIAGALFLVAVSAAQAAKPVPPPTQQLLTEENQIAVITVVAKEPAGKIEVKADEMLHGEPVTHAVIGVDLATLAEVSVGQRYVLAFSGFSKDPLTRGRGWVKNEAGLTAVGFTEVANALLPAEPALLELLRLSPQPEADGQRITLALALLAHPSARLRYLASLELLLNNRLPPAFSPSQRDQLATLLARPDYAPEHRDLLYRVALALPAALQGPWLASQARQTLAQLGHQYDLASRVPSLARTATQVLREHGSAEDAPLLATLLRSNAPGVGKMALEAMQRQAPDALSAAAADALKDTQLPSDTRRALSGVK